jgi:glutamine amidotransferase
MKTIAIVDYGGNLHSIVKAFKAVCDHAIIVTKDANVIKDADRIVLPGQGSAWAAMREIRKNRLTTILRQGSQPILGICLGMQLLGDRSEEGGYVRCLRLIPYGITRLLSLNPLVKLPHVGWNDVIGIGKFYFNHSYILTDYNVNSYDYHNHYFTEYGDNRFIIGCYPLTKKRKIVGVQFHPEKSHKQGLELLSQFVN